MKKALNGKKLKTYTGKNVRLSDDGFAEIKAYVDAEGYKLGHFIENAAIEKIKKQKSK